MRKNFGSKTWMYPLPVLIIATYDEKGHVDAMNAAWGGIYDTNTVMLCLSDNHKTTKNIISKKAFTISYATSEYVKECDYFGVVSGNDVDNKVEKVGLTTVKSKFVDAPIINELPMCIECELIKFNEDGIIIGRIVNVNADESILENGKINPSLLKPITFDPVNNTYIELGQKVGYAFKDGFELK
jgi:flavin reductase (DIM6/NTAB) family NADH-FMN oxidoreductase RutF